jgi:hypothetical protein
MAMLRCQSILVPTTALPLLMRRLLSQPFLVLPFLSCVQHVVPEHTLMKVLQPCGDPDIRTDCLCKNPRISCTQFLAVMS